MTAEKIESISRWANTIFYQNWERVECHGGDFEDFKQTMLLYACMYPEEPYARLLKRIYNDKLKISEEMPYQISSMKMFSELEKRSETPSEFIEQLCGVKEDEYPFEKEVSCVGEIALLLYPKREDLREEFIDFLYGQSSLSSGKRDKIRTKCFNHRFEILAILAKNEKITERERAEFEKIAREMTKKPSVKKVVKDNYNANWLRAKYYENLEESRRKNREKARKRRERLKQEKQAPTTGNKIKST